MSVWSFVAAQFDNHRRGPLRVKPELPSNGLMSAFASCGHVAALALGRFVPTTNITLQRRD